MEETACEGKANWAKRAKTDENRLLEDLLKSGDRERAAAVKKQPAELKKAEKRKAELNTLIEKIIVHDATEDDFGFRQQEIEIIFRFVGKID